MGLSPQAWAIGIIYSILLIIWIGTAIFFRVFGWKSFMTLLISIAYIALFVYDTNCLTKGFCGSWSTIRTGLYLVFPIIFMIVYFVTLRKLQALEKQKKHQ